MIVQAALYFTTADDLPVALQAVAGRPLAFRVVVAAVRAGARRVGVPAVFRGTAVEAAIARSPRTRQAVVWLDGERLAPGPTLLVPAAALTPPSALAAVMTAPPGAVLGASAAGDAPIVAADGTLLAALGSTVADGAPVGDRLARVLGRAEARRVTTADWYVRVRDAATVRLVERRLSERLGSPIDTTLDRVVHRRLSRLVTVAAVAGGVSPNQISIASLGVGLLAAWCFSRADTTAALGGLALYVVAVVLDHSDGEVARLTLAESRLGEWLDILVDTIVHAALVTAMGVTSQVAAAAGAGLGAAAAVGVVASALVAKLWPPTGERGVAGALDGLGSRDGFYAMLALFIAALALARGALPALMLVVALGTHAYWAARLGWRLLGRRPLGTRA